MVGAGHTEITPLRVAMCKSQNQSMVSSASLGYPPHGLIRKQSLQLCSNPQGTVNSAVPRVGQLRGRVAACLHLRQHPHPPAARSPGVAWQGWRWQGAEMVARAGRREKRRERQSRGVCVGGGCGDSPLARRGAKCRLQGAGGAAESMLQSGLSAGSGPGCSAFVDPLSP